MCLRVTLPLWQVAEQSDVIVVSFLYHQVRASGDYVPDPVGLQQWHIGSTSIVAHAVGLAPFKDNFWTTPYQPGSSAGPTGHDNGVWREAAVATLSAGPVTPGDGVLYQNKARSYSYECVP
eukprot:m.201412 g.201412  ORF g.201412 m.201412 type:complete len:121 (-) comp16865_c0_seq5:89-451(-)